MALRYRLEKVPEILEGPVGGKKDRRGMPIFWLFSGVLSGRASPPWPWTGGVAIYALS